MKCGYATRSQDGDFTCGIHGDLRTVRCDGCEHHGPRLAQRLQFKIEQIEIRPENRERARKLLEKIGLTNWIDDTAASCGAILGKTGQNEAELSCCYDATTKEKLKFELINVSGDDWLKQTRQQISSSSFSHSVVSHIGMHCTLAELAKWKALLTAEGLEIVQETTTTEHKNPEVMNSRRYLFCTFGTRHILGCDLKFIVRLHGDEL